MEAINVIVISTTNDLDYTMEPRNHKPGGVRTPADATDKRRRESAAATAKHKDASLRSKRLRRDISAGTLPRDPSTTSLGAPSGDEEAPYVALETPEDIAQRVYQAVAAIKEAANPVGCKRHLEAVRALRQLLSNYEDPPYQAALTAGAIPSLISALQPPRMDTHALETIFEAAWALTNLAVGQAEIVEAVVPAAPILIAYLGGGCGPAVTEQCAWALGNIAAEDAKYREVLIANGAVRPLTRLIVSAADILQGGSGKNNNAIENSSMEVSAGTTAAWALGNILRGAGASEIGELMGTEHAPESLVKLLDGESTPVHTSIEVAWVVAYITAAPSEAHLNRLVNLGVVRPLSLQVIHAAQGVVSGSNTSAGGNFSSQPQRQGEGEDNNNSNYEAMALLMPTLRALGNILGGGGKEAISQVLNSSSILHLEQGGKQEKNAAMDLEPSANPLLLAVVMAAQSSHHGVQREAAWVLSNVAGVQGRDGIEAIKSVGAIPVLMSLLKEQPFHVRKEAAFALANICAGGGGGSGDSESMNYLFGGDVDAVRAMLSLMRSPDVDAARLGLQFTEMLCRLLPLGSKIVEEADGIDAVEKVQFSGDMPSDLQAAAAALVNSYWSLEAEG